MPANEHGCPSKRYFVLRGVNGPHAVVVAPVLIRLDMLRNGSTYELLITQHQPSSADNGTRSQLESKICFAECTAVWNCPARQGHGTRRHSAAFLLFSFR